MAKRSKAAPKAPPETKSVATNVANPVPPRPEGRPSLYEPRYCDELIAHMKLGYSFEAFAGRIGVARSTIYEWVKEHEAFSDAKNIGVEAGRLFWEGLGLRAASGVGSKHFNATAWVFSMKNRFGWKDRTEVAGDQENPIQQKITVTVKRLVPKNAKPQG